MKILAPISGGKDSQAAALWAKEKYGTKNLIYVFCDVKWEAPETYEHIDYFVEKSKVEFKILSSKKYDGMVDLAKKRGRFPSTTARFCTEELKIYPMVDYILSLNESIIIVDGIRADESEKRSKMQPECRYFKYYFEPYITNSLIVENFKNLKKKPSHVQIKKYEKAKERLAKGKEDPKYFTYRKEEVFEWCKKYDDSLIRSVFYMTGDEVIYFSLNRGYKINPRYYMGYSRVGCDPCVMEGINEIAITVKKSPQTMGKVRNAEIVSNSSFFPPDKIPKRYHSKRDKNGKSYPVVDDVIRYVNDKNATLDMFENEPLFRCKSVYNICE
ncbi:phosphoadenosine phosphosulfate reductase domain-containing protein [Empedobacter tilapiae]